MKIIALVAAFAAGVCAQQAGCSPLHLIYARATTEPPANVDSASSEQFEAAAAKYWSKGYGAAGYSLFTNLTKLVPGATGYPVHYPASGTTLGDAMGGQPKGKGFQDMMDQLSKKSKECPNMKFALGGHSQGGMLTVGTIPRIPDDILSRVIAVTMFGSYPCPSKVSGRCNSYCNSGDFVCDLGGGKGKGAAPGPKAGAPPKEPPMKSAKRALVGEMALDGTLNRRQSDSICSDVQPGVKVTGWPAKNPGGHLGYNADGHYVRAAACYIADKFNKAK